MNDTLFALVTVIVGAVLPFLAEWLNDLLKTNGRVALLVVAGLSAFVSVVVLLLTGEVTIQEFTLANFVPVFTAVFGTSQLVFQFFKDQLGWKQIESKG